MPCPCHLEKRRKCACAGGFAQLILYVLLPFAAFSLAKDAAASTGIVISSNLRFGSVTVGTSLARRVTLTNLGTCSITVSQATVTGAGLSISGLVLPLTLNAHHNATFNVEFAPPVGGSVTGTLSIVSDASNLTSSIALSGTGVEQPTANLSPPSMMFASQVLGSTSSAQAVTLTNSGGTTLNTTSVTLTDNATGSPQATSLLRISTSAVSLSPTSLAFGSQQVRTTSTARTVTLSNTSKAGLLITSLSVQGANGSNFAETNTCGRSVAAGSSCAISVKFTPSASGSRTASISIWIGRGSPQEVSLSGTGTLTTATAPVDGLSPTSLAFGSQPVGTTSTALTATLSNTGNAAMSIASLALTGTNAGDFAQTNTCGSSVAASAHCTISVIFTPSASGSRTASVSIMDNASGSPQTVSLSGTGTAALVSLSPTTLAFGNQPVDVTSTAQTVTLSNTGNATLSIGSLAVTGTNASDFAQANTCGSSLAAGANCTIAVMFTPSVTGTVAASLSISDNSSGRPQTVSLSGAGTHDVILSWAASTTPGVVGYDVYRGTTSGGPYPTELNSTPVNGTTYTDATVQAGQTYYYVVTAVASDDVTQSADSNQVSATVPSP